MTSASQPSAPRLVLIAGLQKSGTSLLLRLLADHTSVASNPFTPVEGHDFWGNVPSHAPQQDPAGIIYSSHGGRLGHEIPASAADDRTRRLLHARLAALSSQTPLIVNKNPYHTVRLGWLRSLFPESVIVATVRRAVPNVYSLLKKHVRSDEADRPWRADGWYGVKPRHWQSLLDSDPVVQSARQWRSVMTKLWEDRSFVDAFVGYEDLCANPAGAVRRILRTCGQPAADPIGLPALRCCDDEHQTGAPLQSKNELANLERPSTEVIELPPFSADAVAAIRACCDDVERPLECVLSAAAAIDD